MTPFYPASRSWSIYSMVAFWSVFFLVRLIFGTWVHHVGDCSPSWWCLMCWQGVAVWIIGQGSTGRPQAAVRRLWGGVGRGRATGGDPRPVRPAGGGRSSLPARRSFAVCVAGERRRPRHWAAGRHCRLSARKEAASPCQTSVGPAGEVLPWQRSSRGGAAGDDLSREHAIGGGQVVGGGVPGSTSRSCCGAASCPE